MHDVVNKLTKKQLKHAAKPKRKAGPAQAVSSRTLSSDTTPRDVLSGPARGVSARSLEYIRQRTRPTTPAALRTLFAPYKPAPGVLPEGQAVMAMDSSNKWAMDDFTAATSDWGLGVGSGFASLAGFGIQHFMGFPALTLLAQRAEYRVISEIIATEMTRKWIKLISLDGKEQQKKFDQITAEMTRLHVKECFQKVAEHDGFFGRGHIIPVFANDPDANELKTDIGDGYNKTSQAKIGKGDLVSLRVVEPMWIYPAQYNSTNPFAGDWYRPSQWYVQQKTAHHSRLLTFIGREVPDLLKPAYAFGGLSMSQMAMPTVENWLAIRTGVASIIKAFSVFVLKTNAAELLAGGNADEFYNRLDTFNSTRATLDVMAIDMKSEDFMSVSAPLGGLDHLQAQAQEGMASISRIPLVKLTGISPSGLNATGESEMQCFEDHIHAYQEAFFRPNLTKMLGMIQLSLFGKIDEQIGFEFVPLGELSLKEQAELRQVNASTGEILIRSKAVSSHEERERVVMDREGPYNGLDPDEAVVYPMTEGEKAVYASTIATTAATLVSEAIIGVPTALREIKAAAEISGFGLKITEDDITEAENAPPPPTELGGPEEPGPEEPGPGGGAGAGKGPPATKGLGAGAMDEFNEADHPRGQPENAGQFGPGGGKSKSNKSAAFAHQSTKIVEGKRVTASGGPLPAHVAALKIPPAWTDVTFSPDPKHALQATGRDSKGRQQAIYSAEFSANQAAAKFSRISELNAKFDKIVTQNEKLRASKDPKQAAAADCLRLIMETGIRPGSEGDTGAEKQAYGATTLEGRHVVVEDGKVTLKFTGKKGVALSIPVTDPETAAMLRERKKVAKDDGQLFDINEKALLEHSNSMDGGSFKTKDFRTLLGTKTAMSEVARVKAPTNMAEYKKAVKAVAVAVSKKLGNTPTIALQSYINPSVFAGWRIAA